jgi:IS30 family transposase
VLQAGCSRKEICIATGKDKSVISRELKRNSSKQGYSPQQAQMYAQERKERFRMKRKFTETDRTKVVRELTEEQSPEQIVGRVRRDGILMVSHERIYQYICSDKKQGGTLYKDLRHRLKHRKRPVGGKKVIIPTGFTSICERILSIKNSALAIGRLTRSLARKTEVPYLTATERQTGFLLMKKLLKGKNVRTLAK